MNLKQIKKLSLFKYEKVQSIDLLKSQGFCNINYLIKTKNNSYLLREFKNKKNDNTSKKFEFKIQNKAYKKGIAARAIYLKKEYMICDYLKGHHKYVLNKNDIKELALKIKTLHKIKVKKEKYDFTNDIKSFQKNLKDKKSKKIIRSFKKELKTIKSYKEEMVTSHHDLNPNNILFNNDKIKFIDWEYACTNDKYFDLASVCFEFKLNQREEQILLQTYLKKVSKKDYKKLKSYKRIYKFLYQLWFKDLNV